MRGHAAQGSRGSMQETSPLLAEEAGCRPSAARYLILASRCPDDVTAPIPLA